MEELSSPLLHEHGHLSPSVSERGMEHFYNVVTLCRKLVSNPFLPTLTALFLLCAEKETQQYENCAKEENHLISDVIDLCATK